MKELTNSYHGGIKNKGFTLIELLAVIVILAIIALIATPIVLSILTKVRKSAFHDSAYGIMEAAKSYFAEMIIDENNPEDIMFSFEDGATNLLSYSGSKPKGGMLVLSKNGEIELAIHNNEWCAIKGKTENNVGLIKYEKNKCKISEDIEVPLISVKDSKSETIKKGFNKVILEYFNIVSGTATCIDISDSNKTVTDTSSLDIGTHDIECTVVENGKSVKATKTIVVESSERVLTEEMMIAEVGSNGTIRTDNLGNKRYAGSNPNNYVCFGTQSETCDKEHLYRIIGIIDGKIKLIKNSIYGNELFAWDTSNSNNWDRPATLKTELNGSNFYGNSNYIDEMGKNYIAEATWYTGGLTTGPYTLADFEDNERSSTSIGYVGLMSVTDYGYASNDTYCRRDTNVASTSSDNCKYKNYLLYGSTENQWTITLYGGQVAGGMFLVGRNGGVSSGSVPARFVVRPSLFLKPEVKIIGGKGTEQEPYRLSL